MEQVPRILAGRYEVGELIGRGGMAEVHIGRDNRLSRRVAIKLLRSDLAQDSTFQARFRREAQSAAALNHPAVVSVYDTGEDTGTSADGSEQHLPFIVMEYVEGHTVRDLLRDGSALPLDEAVDITSGVLSALEYSHHAGIVHRDIKPANVMITPAGDVKVMDFGIARAIADSAATMTQTQAVVGTAQYLSPEQARGEVVDARSDVYSTGALLFELLTGRPPFIGDSPVAVAYQHVREDPPTPSALAPDVPEELDRIVLKALAKDRTVRYQSAEEFRADLEAAVRGGVVGAPAVGVIAAANAASHAPATQVLGGPPASTTRTTPAISEEEFDAEDEKRGRGWIWALAILGVLLLGGLAYAIYSMNQNEPDPEPTPTAVQVPPVEGLDQATIRTEFAELELTPDFSTTEASDTIEADLAIRSEPAAGQEVEPGSSVSVVMSTGPDSFTMPDFSGRTQQQVRTELQSEGFDLSGLSVETANDPSQARDRVVSSSPAAGESVARDGDIVVTLSTGQVDVPDLTGMTRDEAQQALAEVTITPRFQDQPSGDFEPGQVVDWDNRDGQVERFSQLTVFIAVPPVETATPSPTPDPTPSETPSPTEPPPPEEDEDEG